MGGGAPSPSPSAPTDLSAARTLRFALGASAAALTNAGIVLVAYSWADRLVALLGPAQARVVTRLSAFLLLCVGVQITLSGVAEFWGRCRSGLRVFLCGNGGSAGTNRAKLTL